MPVALIIEIVSALAAFAPEVPAVAGLVENASTILKTGTVTSEQEAAIRDQLDTIKAAIDAA